MSSIFLSHSSHDAAHAERLANALKAHGHHVWLDRWEIRVGECIHARIDNGLHHATFMILLLSRHAVRSSWVEREWRAAHWNEIESNSVALLPVLLEDCDIPPLLRTKKYADFRASYNDGLRDLLEAIRYFDTLKADREFFRAIPTVWAEERSLDGGTRLARNEHWDDFASLVEALPQVNREAVQEANSVHYLHKYQLTIHQLKAQLARVGFYAGTIDDQFGIDVTRALESFQRAFNLRHVDGIFGPLTYLTMAEAAKNLE